MKRRREPASAAATGPPTYVRVGRALDGDEHAQSVFTEPEYLPDLSRCQRVQVRSHRLDESDLRADADERGLSRGTYKRFAERPRPKGAFRRLRAHVLNCTLIDVCRSRSAAKRAPAASLRSLESIDGASMRATPWHPVDASPTSDARLREAHAQLKLGLTGRQFRILIGCDHENLSSTEMARRLDDGTSADVVRVELSRARRRARGLLARAYPELVDPREHRLERSRSRAKTSAA